MNSCRKIKFKRANIDTNLRRVAENVRCFCRDTATSQQMYDRDRPSPAEFNAEFNTVPKQAKTMNPIAQKPARNSGSLTPKWAVDRPEKFLRWLR